MSLLRPVGEFVWKGGGEEDFLAGGGVLEAELAGVEHEAVGVGEAFALFAVDGVAENRCADVFEVDADLVGAAGVEGAFDEAGAVALLGEDFVVGDGGLACARVEDGHLLAIDGVAADVGEDGVLVFGRRAGGDGVVDLGHRFALGELAEQGLHGVVGLGDDDAARGVFVETVHDAGTLDSVDASELAVAVMKEGVDEGAVGIAGGGVDDHAVGFVEDDEVFVFVENVEGKILGNEFEGDGLGDGDADEVAGMEGLLGFGGAVVDEDVAFFDEGLKAGARVFFETRSEEGVEAGVRAVDLDGHPVGWIFTTKEAKNTKFLMLSSRGVLPHFL